MYSIKIEKSAIYGFEPVFNKHVIVAHIDHDNKEIRPTHGYFVPHTYGKKVQKYAESIGYEFIQR